MTIPVAGRGSRAAWVTLLLGVLGVLTLSAVLEPSPSGHGTHTQLGLPPCGFFSVTGLRCPGCGLTTAFAHMVRLDIVEAVSANPLGVVLFVIMVATVPVSMAAVVRRRTIDDVLRRPFTGRLAAVVIVSAVLTVAVRAANDL